MSPVLGRKQNLIVKKTLSSKLRGCLSIVATCRDGAGRRVCARPPFVTVHCGRPSCGHGG